MEREALKLHSITFTSLSLQMNWMLKGPGHARPHDDWMEMSHASRRELLIE